MAQELGVVLAMAVIIIILAITMAAPVKPASNLIAATPPSEAIYRPQHLNLY